MGKRQEAPSSGVNLKVVIPIAVVAVIVLGVLYVKLTTKVSGTATAAKPGAAEMPSAAKMMEEAAKGPKPGDAVGGPVLPGPGLMPPPGGLTPAPGGGPMPAPPGGMAPAPAGGPMPAPPGGMTPPP